MTCTGVILAGGEASRYGGRPKGLERVEGARIIDRVADALRATTDSLLLIANAPTATEWLPGVRVAADLRRGEGALGGLHAALTHAGSDVLVVAWDMPFVPSTLLAALRARAAVGNADAVLPESEGSGRGVEPLCAWYSLRCLPAIEESLARGDRRVIGFHSAIRTARLSHSEVATFGDPARIFGNVNTPADLDALAARERVGG